MCEPATLAIIGTAVAAGGQIQSGMYAAGTAKYAAKVAKQNAELEREAASDAIARGQEEQRRLGRQVAQTVGQQTARLAANNVDITVGSAARTIQDTMDLGAEEAAVIAENVNRQVQGYQINAWNYESQRRTQKAEARQAKIATAINVANTVLGGAKQYAKFKASSNG